MNSKVLYLLQNNEEPDDAHCAYMKSHLEHHTNTITNNDFHTKEWSSTSSSSTLESIQLYSSYCRILSATRKIPNEVLEFIFRNILDDEEVAAGKCSSAIASVCRRWRTVARPLLPSAGTFCVPHGTFSSRTRTKEVSNEFGSFIQTLPSPTLSRFSLIIADPLSEPTILDSPIIDVLFAESSRWVSLTMEIDSSVFHPLTGRLRNCVDTLQMLKLTVIPGPFTAYFHLFENAKGLRHVEIIIDGGMIVHLPHNQLSSYREKSLGDASSVSWLLHQSTLKRLERIVHTTPDLPFHLNRTRADEPANIEWLDLKIYNANLIPTYVLKRREYAIHCTLPQLKSIRLRDPNRNPVTSLTALIDDSFAGPSQSLTRIAIHGQPWAPGELDDLLQLTPNLMYLECSDIPSVDLFLLSRQKPMRVPLLDTLIIHDAKDMRDVQQTVTARNSPRSSTLQNSVPLSTVRLLYQNPQDTAKSSNQIGILQKSADPELEANLKRLEAVLGGGSERLKTAASHITSVFNKLLRPVPRAYNAGKIAQILDRLEAFQLSDQCNIQLIHIHLLHSISLLPAFSSLGYHRNRVTALLAKWITVFQLQCLMAAKLNPSPVRPKWITIAPHCVALYQASFSQNNDDSRTENMLKCMPTEHDILYGCYRAPTVEEVLWVHKDCS